MQANIYVSVLSILVLLILFFLFGSMITCRIKKDDFSLLLSINIGFMVYFATFEIVALPMKLLLQPLSKLSIMWGIVCLIVSSISIVVNKNEWVKSFRNVEFKNTIRNSVIVCIVLGALSYLITNNILLEYSLI